MTNRIIPGEYDCVSRASLNPKRLKAAHETPCDPATAYFLLAVMHKQVFPNDEHPMPLVRIRAPRKGKNTGRGWGGAKHSKDGSGNVTWRGYVSLPNVVMTNKAHPYGTLRIGLVCHEYAHAVECLKFKSTGHSPRFTAILDSLLFATEQYWQVRATIAAEVK